jgi:hypothetical protein
VRSENLVVIYVFTAKGRSCQAKKYHGAHKGSRDPWASLAAAAPWTGPAFNFGMALPIRKRPSG